MTFIRKFAAQVEAFNQAQKVKAWSFITGLVAAIYAIGITSLVSSRFSNAPDLETVIVVFWAAGAIFGAASLITFGIVNSPSKRQRRFGEIGLWAGNLVVSANTLVYPIVMPLALIPVIGGFVVLSQRSTVVGRVYLSLPFIAFGAVVLDWALGSPIAGIIP